MARSPAGLSREVGKLPGGAAAGRASCSGRVSHAEPTAQGPGERALWEPAHSLGHGAPAPPSVCRRTAAPGVTDTLHVLPPPGRRWRAPRHSLHWPETTQRACTLTPPPASGVRCPGNKLPPEGQGTWLCCLTLTAGGELEELGGGSKPKKQLLPPSPQGPAPADAAVPHRRANAVSVTYGGDRPRTCSEGQ